MEHLSLNMQSARFQPDRLMMLEPFSVEYDPETYYVGSITPIAQPNAKEAPKRKACLVKVVDSLKNEIKALDFPGGIDIRLIQQDSSNWIAIFASTRKIVSAYMRMKAEDVQRLIAEGLGD